MMNKIEIGKLLSNINFYSLCLLFYLMVRVGERGNEVLNRNVEIAFNALLVFVGSSIFITLLIYFIVGRIKFKIYYGFVILLVIISVATFEYLFVL